MIAFTSMFIFSLVIIRCTYMAFLGHWEWVILRKGGFLKIWFLILVIFSSKIPILFLTLVFDCLILPSKYSLHIYSRIIAGVLLSFLGNNFLPFFFLVNPLTYVDSVRLFAGGPYDTAKTALTMVKFYQDLPPKGKWSFGAAAIVTAGTLGVVSYYDYGCLVEFNQSYEAWLENQKLLNEQYILYNYGEDNAQLLKQYQLTDIQNTYECLKWKQKFLLHTPFHPGLDFTDVITKYTAK